MLTLLHCPPKAERNLKAPGRLQTRCQVCFKRTTRHIGLLLRAPGTTSGFAFSVFHAGAWLLLNCSMTETSVIEPTRHGETLLLRRCTFSTFWGKTSEARSHIAGTQGWKGDKCVEVERTCSCMMPEPLRPLLFKKATNRRVTRRRETLCGGPLLRRLLRVGEVV